MICVMTVSTVRVADIAKLSKEEQADTVKKQLPIYNAPTHSHLFYYGRLLTLYTAAVPYTLILCTCTFTVNRLTN